MSSNTKKRDNKSETLAGTIILCIGIILLTILFPKIYSGDFANLETVTAEITSVELDDNITETSFIYNYKGKDYQGSSEEIKKSFVGQKIEIYVDPELPTSVYFRNDLSRMLVMMRLFAISVIAIASFLLIKSKAKDLFT